jgi:hypothetical protein
MNISLDLIKNESARQIMTLIVSTFGSIAALAWNKAFIDLISKTPGLKKYGLWIYAMLITVIYVIILLMLNKKEEDKEKN